MADLNLRAALSLVDRFSGPLKKVLAAVKSVSPLLAAIGLTKLITSLSDGASGFRVSKARGKRVNRGTPSFPRKRESTFQ